MTIKTIYKVDGDSNEYESEQEAQVADAIQNEDGLYCDSRTTLKVAKAITKKFLLCPVRLTVTAQKMEKTIKGVEEAGRELV